MLNIILEMEVAWKCLVTSEAESTEDLFWNAVGIWNKKPHTVNRRISSAIHLLVTGMCDEVDISFSVIKSVQSLDFTSDENSDTIKILLQDKGLLIEDLKEDGKRILYVKKILPRNYGRFKPTYEIAVFDKVRGVATFLPLGKTNLITAFPYRLLFNSNRNSNQISIEIPSSQDPAHPSCIWLMSQFFWRLNKWARAKSKGNKVTELLGANGTLTLVCVERYNELYQHLKKKYGQEMVKIWPECTDPSKFVYEDVAIATYLLQLWEGQGPISFVDLGCGNGLLVHILNSEGHCGLGVDVRSRKIWNLYPSTTKLEVRAITPSDSHLFPEADWIIGNHSDELTPWVPVIAARSSLKCKYFLLPCCAYDFDGHKFQRQKAQSRYSAYLEYIQSVSDGCGFKTLIDRLRIPSTKRVCLVGQERTFSAEEWPEVDTNISQMIEDGCRDYLGNVKVFKGWVPNFKPRESVEKVRNCTQLDRSLIDDIVLVTVNHLLSKRRLLPMQNSSDKMWNAGGICAIGDLVPLIGAEKLKGLKEECGGLQTLLRNNHSVFLVERGKVQLRQPAPTSGSGEIRLQSKPCWFHQNHPDGCLLKDEECAYKHV